MEYKINNIDTHLLNVINEQTREGKIHTKLNILVNSERGKESYARNKRFDKSKKKEPFRITKYVQVNRKIEIKVYKSDLIEIEAEKVENCKKDYDKGLFIDIRK